MALACLSYCSPPAPFNLLSHYIFYDCYWPGTTYILCFIACWQPLAKELGIRVVPTFKVLKDGKVVKEVTGAKFDDLVFAIESVRSS